MTKDSIHSVDFTAESKVPETTRDATIVPETTRDATNRNPKDI